MRPHDGDGGGDGDGDSGGGGGRLFAGVRFALYGFDAITEAQFRSELVRRGEADAGGYGPADRCTHLLVEERVLYDDPACVAARHNGSKVLTKIWIEDTLQNGTKAENTDNVLYRPVKSTNGITGFEALHICCTGFNKKKTQDIEKLVRMAGAQFHDITKMFEATYIICRAFERADFKLSEKMKIIAVNYLWLQECFTKWSLVPARDFTKRKVEKTPSTKSPTSTRSKISYTVNDEKMCTPSNGHSRKQFMPQSDSKQSMVTPTMPAIKQRNAISTGYKRRKSCIGADDDEYTAIRMGDEDVMNAEGKKNIKITGEPKCKRVLDLGGSSKCIGEVIPLHLPPGDPATERTLYIDGTPEQIEFAKQLVSEVTSENRARNPLSGGYSQQGYPTPRTQANWGAPSAPTTQQPGCYMQPGAYTGAPPQYGQLPYGSYPPASGGYQTGWDQSSYQQPQQTPPGTGYDYYNQQQQPPPPQQQQQPAPGTAAPADASTYNYSQLATYASQGYGDSTYSQQSGGQQAYDYSGYQNQGQQQQAYSQQTGYDQHSYGTAGYRSAANSAQDGSAPSYGGPGGASQASPGKQASTPATGSNPGYSSQPPTSAPSNYPAQGSSQRMNLRDYAWERKLSKLRKVPGSKKILRLSLPDPKLILLGCFAHLPNLHRQKKTLAGHFDAINFVISLADNTVTLENLHEPLTYNDEDGDLDYTSFVTMVKSLYHGKPIPLDVSKWWKAEQLTNFILMMDDTAAFGAFQSMYHSFLEFEHKKNTEFWDMVDSKVMSKHTKWKWNIKNSFLWKAFDWKDHLGIRIVYEANVKGLFRLTRNCWEHPARLMQSQLLCILLANYEDLLPDVQKALSDAGYLKHLRI